MLHLLHSSCVIQATWPWTWPILFTRAPNLVEEMMQLELSRAQSVKPHLLPEISADWIKHAIISFLIGWFLVSISSYRTVYKRKPRCHKTDFTPWTLSRSYINNNCSLIKVERRNGKVLKFVRSYYLKGNGYWLLKWES